MIRDCYSDTQEKLLAHIALKGKRILEIGCGAGRVTAMYAADACLAVGVEPEEGAVVKATNAVPQAVFFNASGMALPFADGSFDVVLFTLSLHHHPDCLTALAEARRVLCPDGAVAVLEPTPESEIQRLCKPFEDEDHRLIAVEAALPRGPLGIVSRETFDTHWTFSDFEDVADYAFTYFAQPQDAGKREAIREFLGSKAAHAPIRLTDTLRLTCLRRP